MLLGENRIREEVNTNNIIVEPSPTEYQYQPASLDIRLGDKFTPIDSGIQPMNFDELSLTPDCPVLVNTKEHVDLPENIAAQVTGRSSIGRNGIMVHITAGWIDPGFSGKITLEMLNVSQREKTLRSGERVAQLCFFEVDGGTLYDGQYQGQQKPQK